MPNPVKELAKLTCRAKQIDGMGFGGGAAVDNLEVAAILGMANPNTGKKISREAYNFARYIYCGDKPLRVNVKASMLNKLIKEDTGKISDVVILKLVFTALKEFQNPSTKFNTLGGQEITSYSNYKIAHHLGIKPQSITAKHKSLYGILSATLHEWSSEAISHINSHYNDI